MSISTTPFLVRTNTPHPGPYAYTQHYAADSDPLEAQNVSQEHKRSLPIAIPRRKSARPPPRSPLRHQASPDLMFNLEFSPCSPQGTGLMARMDAWSRTDAEWTQPFLQQRGRTNLLLAHQCQQQQKLMFSRRTYSPAQRHRRSLLRETRPVLRDAQDRAYTPNEETLVEDQENRPCNPDLKAFASRPLSPGSRSSSVCSSAVFATPPADIPDSEYMRGAQEYSGQDEDDVPYLTHAFQCPVSPTSLTMSTQSVTATSQQTTSISPMTFRMPSPISPPRTRPRRAQRALPLDTIFPVSAGRDRAAVQAHLRSAAAPVVSFKVVQAERASPVMGPGVGTRVRGRSPYPGLETRTRQRRSSSAGAPAPTVVGTGRVLSMRAPEGSRGSSLVLSNEDIERSLEKEERIKRDGRWERERERERGYESAAIDEKVWEVERGRPRGRPRGRDIGAAIGAGGGRAAPRYL